MDVLLSCYNYRSAHYEIS